MTSSECWPVELLREARRLFFWGAEYFRDLCLFTSPIKKPMSLTGGLLGSVSSFKGLSMSCFHFIVVLYCVYGWTVPLNHFLLIPAELDLSIHYTEARGLVMLSWTRHRLHRFFFITPSFQICFQYLLTPFFSYKLLHVSAPNASNLQMRLKMSL